MRHAIELLRTERRARWFFGALTQSSLGTGAAIVALLVVAYDRLPSGWGISLVLLAEFVPAMLLGPVFGAAADRWSRRSCAIAADVLRAVAFVGIGLTHSFVATMVFALLAGIGTALFRPATLAAMPSLVAPQRAAAATALFGAIADLGFTVGPAIAAVALLVVGPETLLVANGATFAISVAVLARLDFGARAPGEDSAAESSLLKQARSGVKVVAGLPAVAALIAISGIAMLSGGIFNVIELPFAKNVLDAGDSGYSALVAVYGLGFAVGSVKGSRGGEQSLLKRRYVQGLALTGIGGLLAAASPSLVVAMAAFALGGFGNGTFVVYQRLLINAAVPERLQGRTFGLADAATSWGFVVALVAAGALTPIVGTRELMVATGVWEVGLALAALDVLRRRWAADRGESATGGLSRRSADSREAGPRTGAPARHQRLQLLAGPARRPR